MTTGVNINRDAMGCARVMSDCNSADDLLAGL